MNLKRLGNVTHGASIPVGAIIVTPYVAFPLAFILGVHVFDDDAAFVDRCCPVADVGEPAPKIVAVPFLDIILVIIPDVFAALGGPDGGPGARPAGLAVPTVRGARAARRPGRLKDNIRRRNDVSPPSKE